MGGRWYRSEYFVILVRKLFLFFLPFFPHQFPQHRFHLEMLIYQIHKLKNTQNLGVTSAVTNSFLLDTCQVVLVLSTFSAPIESFLEGGSTRLYRRWLWCVASVKKCSKTWSDPSNKQLFRPSLTYQHGLWKILPRHFAADQQHLHTGGVWGQRGTRQLCKSVVSGSVGEFLAGFDSDESHVCKSPKYISSYFVLHLNLNFNCFADCQNQNVSFTLEKAAFFDVQL